jgi:hypothetical protein
VARHRCSGTEPFHTEGRPIGGVLLDFWQWSDSDLRSNALRGRLAEYLVARDLGIAEGVRSEWIAYDLETKAGTKIEVKSAAYVQAWSQRRPSLICFDIRPTLGWDPHTAKFGERRQRQADVYVFCLLSEKDEQELDPLNLNQWQFFVLPTAVLDQNCPTQKTLSLDKLLTFGPEQTRFGQIAAAVGRASTFCT